MAHGKDLRLGPGAKMNPAHGFVLLVLLGNVAWHVVAQCDGWPTQLPRLRSRCCASANHCCRHFNSEYQKNLTNVDTCAPGPPHRVNISQAGNKTVIRWRNPKVNKAMLDRVLGYRFNLTCQWTNRKNDVIRKQECFEVIGSRTTKLQLVPSDCDREENNIGKSTSHCVHSSIYSEFYVNAGQHETANCSLQITSMPMTPNQHVTERFTLISCRSRGCPSHSFLTRHLCDADNGRNQISATYNRLCECSMSPPRELQVKRNTSNPNSYYLVWQRSNDPLFMADQYTVLLYAVIPYLWQLPVNCTQDSCELRNFSLPQQYSKFKVRIIASLSGTKVLSATLYFTTHAVCRLPQWKNVLPVGIRRDSVIPAASQHFASANFSCKLGYRFSSGLAHRRLTCRYTNGSATFPTLPPCLDIDECESRHPLHTCQSTERCRNTVGSFVCECISGYYRGRDGCTKCTVEDPTLAVHANGSVGCQKAGYTYVNRSTEAWCHQQTGLWVNTGRCAALCSRHDIEHYNVSVHSAAVSHGDVHSAFVVSCQYNHRFESSSQQPRLLNCSVSEGVAQLDPPPPCVALSETSSPPTAQTGFTSNMLVVILCLVVVSALCGVVLIARRVWKRRTTVMAKDGEVDRPTSASDLGDESGTTSMVDLSFPQTPILMSPASCDGALPSVYISYCRYQHGTEMRAEQLACKLHFEHQLDVRIASKNLHGGESDFFRSPTKWIERNMEQSQYILVVISQFYPHCYDKYCSMQPQHQPVPTSAVSHMGSSLPKDDSVSTYCHQAGEDMLSRNALRLKTLLQAAKQNKQMHRAAAVATQMSYDDMCEENPWAAFECLVLDGFLTDPRRVQTIIPVYLEAKAFTVPLPSYMKRSGRYFAQTETSGVGHMPASMRTITGDFPKLLERLTANSGNSGNAAGAV